MLGDPHALDDGTVVGSLLVQQLASRDRLAVGKLTAGDVAHCYSASACAATQSRRPC